MMMWFHKMENEFIRSHVVLLLHDEHEVPLRVFHMPQSLMEERKRLSKC